MFSRRLIPVRVASGPSSRYATKGSAAISLAILLPVAAGAFGLVGEAGAWFEAQRRAKTTAVVAAVSTALDHLVESPLGPVPSVPRLLRKDSGDGGNVAIEYLRSESAEVAFAVQARVSRSFAPMIARSVVDSTVPLEAIAIADVVTIGGACLSPTMTAPVDWPSVHSGRIVCMKAPGAPDVTCMTPVDPAGFTASEIVQGNEACPASGWRVPVMGIRMRQ